MHTLIIQHVPDTDPAQFQVVRPEDGKRTDPVGVSPPQGYAIEGRPESDLVRELQWYLETFLEYPFSPETEHAERVQETLRTWGEQTFEAVFGSRQSSRLFEDAVADGFDQLHVQISSDDAHILAWPWEAVRDAETGWLTQTCRIERRLNRVRDPHPLSSDLPQDGVNILLVTARPYDDDVQYRSISRPLVELVADQHLPAQVHVLRPPTFDRLREHLRERPNVYHILHFDGHGAYSRDPAATGYTLGGREGRLVFEDDDGNPDPITAEKLSALLREHRLPAIVLNACQSAMLDRDARDSFASVATALLQSGVRSVVAMAYSLYVSGAQQFLPAFYRRLFESGSVAEAARAGRQEMFAHRDRVCARGQFPLDDWLVPVVYQQGPMDFTFARAVSRPEVQGTRLPDEAREAESPHGFIGRDAAILALERALRRSTAAVLIQGLGGIGKTTLARGFLHWLESTEGLGAGCIWLSFQDIRSADYVLNRMGESIYASSFAAAPTEDKVEALVEIFKVHRFLIVWDNFEVVRGIAGTEVHATLPEADQQLLLQFLTRLRGGQTKVIITSRSQEEWLGIQRLPIHIGGLRGEERWQFCDAILRDLGLTVNREDADLVALMDLLNGHPLAMRVVLPKLEGGTAVSIVNALQSNLAALGPGEDEAQAKLYATLQLAEQSLPEDLHPLLIPLALHERFVQANIMEIMAQQVDLQWSRVRIDDFFRVLAIAGLVTDRGQAVYEMHPALAGFLRSAIVTTAADEDHKAWQRAFVNIMGRLADNLAPRPLHEQRGMFFWHRVNFYTALHEAERLAMSTGAGALLQSLAVFAQHMRHFQEAHMLFARLAENGKNRSWEEGEAAAYHRLGMIAQERRNFQDAEAWYKKSLLIDEKLGNEHGAANTYHQLGRIAQERGDFQNAEIWYKKTLLIDEKLGNEHGAASTYHQLGRIAQERRDFQNAEAWYKKSLLIKEKLGDEHGAASTYGQLGLMNAQQEQFESAGQWLIKCLQAFLRTQSPHYVDMTRMNFLLIYQQAPPADQATLRAMWDKAGLGPFPEDQAEESPA